MALLKQRHYFPDNKLYHIFFQSQILLNQTSTFYPLGQGILLLGIKVYTSDMPVRQQEYHCFLLSQ
ncbi:hypothetical protein [Candidatus Williamhamiltonella defendens]|uniref:hypothetical protein n=1 Tax=Candidatus Williamhamiltonella defendens TaxID=138072 RepID=UPI001651A2AE|nr:hypothetical protein [Candidatus Hamiltonella defensa]